MDLEDFQHGIKVLNCVVDINRVVDALSEAGLNGFDDDVLDALMFKLANPNAHLQDVRVKSDQFKKRYVQTLVSLRRIKNNNNSLVGGEVNGNGKHNGNHDKTNNVSLSDDSEDCSDLSNCSSSGSVGCNLLTHGEIQECIAQTNSDYEQECLG